MVSDPVCPVDLTADLIRCPSVTPEDGGALVLLEKVLSDAGFVCTRVDRRGTPNLFARWGKRGTRAHLASTGIRMWCHWATPMTGRAPLSGASRRRAVSGGVEPVT